MADTEQALDNLINGQGWGEGAASPERLGSFLNRRMAQLALAEAEVGAEAYEDFEDIAA
jgi:hypothetical protein